MGLAHWQLYPNQLVGRHPPLHGPDTIITSLNIKKEQIFREES